VLMFLHLVIGEYESLIISQSGGGDSGVKSACLSKASKAYVCLASQHAEQSRTNRGGSVDVDAVTRPRSVLSCRVVHEMLQHSAVALQCVNGAVESVDRAAPEAGRN
jgi:hypothetical protein